MVRALRASPDWARDCGSLELIILVFVASMFSGSAIYQGLSPSNGSGAGVVAGRAQAGGQLPVFDPAATAFSSQLSYGAMREITPILFGDFLSPISLKLAPSFAGPMGTTAGFDPAVSTTLNQTLQQGLVPAGGPAEAEEFAVGQSDVGLPSAFPATHSAGPPSTDQFVGIVGYSATAGDLPSLSSDDQSGRAPSACPDSETARDLRTSSRFWGPQTKSALPTDFPKGVFSGRNESNPLGDLGPIGDRANLPSTGPGGSWCRPGPTPFDLTSPLEDQLVWILFGALAGGLLVFYLTRGISLPA